jgi:glycosyltransferase involved in cell wall biosynthesis
MLKVVHLQAATFSAGRAAFRLHNAFLEENIDSSTLSLWKEVNDTEKMKNVKFSSTIFAWVDAKIQKYLTRNAVKEYGQFSYPVLGNDVSRLEQVKNADVIYIHWILAGFLTLNNIEKVAKLGKPVIVFMHDMWTITGGCHHSFTCENYKTECIKCPIFPGKGMLDLPDREFKRKLKIFSKYKNLYFVAPSKWLYNCAKESFLTKDKPVFHIPNIVNSKQFKPYDKTTVRQILDIDTNDIVLAFGAVNIESPYKGWTFLQRALEILNEKQTFRNISVLVFGSGYNKRIADSIPFKAKFTGFLNDEYSTSLIYSAADIFVTPSLADNLPTTVLESLSCATPVVGFEVGGIPDMIEHKVNGYLARYRDAEDLAAGIEYCLTNNIKGKLLPPFEKSNIVAQHLELLKSITSDS